MRWTTPRSSGNDPPKAVPVLSAGYLARRKASRRGNLSRQRFSALAPLRPDRGIADCSLITASLKFNSECWLPERNYELSAIPSGAPNSANTEGFPARKQQAFSHKAHHPPSTSKVVPVTKDAASLARKTAGPTISFISALRRKGVRAMMSRSASLRNVRPSLVMEWLV